SGARVDGARGRAHGRRRRDPHRRLGRERGDRGRHGPARDRAGKPRPRSGLAGAARRGGPDPRTRAAPGLSAAAGRDEAVGAERSRARLMGLLDFFRKVEWRVDPATGRHAQAIADLHTESFARGWSASEIEALMADYGTVADIL